MLVLVVCVWQSYRAAMGVISPGSKLCVFGRVIEPVWE